ncbi:MAG: lysylphosphatidylglycerol synthase transmembrane domain-containing protein [Spirochaetales bacterium]
MDFVNRLDRFFLARYKRLKKLSKRKAYLKSNNTTKYKAFKGKWTIAFFVSREQRREKIAHQKADKYIEQEQIKSANEVVAVQKSKKKWWSIIFLFVNIIVIALIMKGQLDDYGFQPFSDLIGSSAHFNYLYLAFLGFPLLVLLDWSRFYLLLTKTLKRSRHFLSYKVSAIGRYYDLITPLGSGGQPFQIYYLSKRCVKSQIATSVPLARYIYSQIIFVVVALAALITNYSATGNNAIVVTAAAVGVGLNIILLGGVLVLSVSKKIGPRITIWVLKLLNKLHIVKNYEIAFRKVMRFVKEYQKSMRYFTSNIIVVIASLIISLLYVLVLGSIPFFIYSAFNGFDPSMWWPIVSKIVMLEFAVGFIPLPGGAGAAEISFSAMFASLFTGGSFFWAIIMWRFIVYYAFILQGILVMIYDMVIGDKKAERLKKIGFWEDFTQKGWLARLRAKQMLKRGITTTAEVAETHEDKNN